MVSGWELQEEGWGERRGKSEKVSRLRVPQGGGVVAALVTMGKAGRLPLVAGVTSGGLAPSGPWPGEAPGP